VKEKGGRNLDRIKLAEVLREISAIASFNEACN